MWYNINPLLAARAGRGDEAAGPSDSMHRVSMRLMRPPLNLKFTATSLPRMQPLLIQ